MHRVHLPHEEGHGRVDAERRVHRICWPLLAPLALSAFLHRSSHSAKGSCFSSSTSLFLEGWRGTWMTTPCFFCLTLRRSRLKSCGGTERRSDSTRPKRKVCGRAGPWPARLSGSAVASRWAVRSKRLAPAAPGDLLPPWSPQRRSRVGRISGYTRSH